ncbi:MAG: hypothetical protein FJ278_17285, partial [Planctomycetes bacterium]|nr:hypothetical protein [Planctomycetota bacterium]
QSIFLRHVWVGETFLLAEGLRGVFQVALSPDGKRIAWAKTEPSGASGIWTASIAKKPKKVKPDRCVRLGPPAASASHIFDWTPDSKQIVYVAQNRLWVKSAGKRGKPEPITPEGWAASMPVSSFEADLIACAVAEKGDLVGVAAMTDEGEERRWAMKDSLELRRAAALEARTGDPEAAKSLLARAIERTPYPQAESEAARELAALHLKSDEVEKGIGLLKEVVRDPLALGRAHLLHLRDADRARAELAQVTDEKGRAEAEPLLMAMSELDADALEQFCLAAVAKSNGDLAAAVEHGGQVVELSPHSHTAKGLAADVAKMAPDVKERSIALEALDQVIRAYPDRVEGDQAKLSKARVLRASRSKGPPWRLLFWRTKSDEPPPPKRFADVKEIYDQLEFAQSRSPRVAQVLSDAAEFLAEDLRDYPGAADKLEKLIAFKAGSRDAAKEVSEEKVKEFSEQLLGYELRAIDLYLTKLNDVPKAMAVARRSPGFELKGDRVDVKGILEVIKRFDEARRHKEANALLAEAMKAASPDDWFSLSLEDLAYMAKFVKKDVLVRCRLGHLPGWLDSRIQIALASLTQQTQDAEVARFAMQV